VTGVDVVFVNVTTGKSYGQSCIVSSHAVISSAGAVGTPKLLLLSGIGPEEKLASLKIPIVSANENVGANLHDHFGVGVFAANGATTFPIVDNSVNTWGQAFWNVENDAALPLTFNIELYGYPLPGPIDGVPYPYTQLNPTRVFTDSVGVVSINSSDPDVYAYVNPNYLSTMNDKRILAYALNKSLELRAGLGLENNPEADPCLLIPGANCDTQLDTLNVYLEAGLGNPGYHLTGTAAICSVVNPLHLNVKGVRGLYVLDASLFPLSPSANTQSDIYAVAERGIDLIEASILNGFEESILDFIDCAL